jgi:hypothetical protein
MLPDPPAFTHYYLFWNRVFGYLERIASPGHPLPLCDEWARVQILSSFDHFMDKIN